MSHTTSFPAEVPVRAWVLLKWKTDWLNCPTRHLKVCGDSSQAVFSPQSWLCPPQAERFLLGPHDIPSLSHGRTRAPGENAVGHLGERALLELGSGKPGLSLSEGDTLGPGPLFLLKGMGRDSAAASRKAKSPSLLCSPGCSGMVPRTANQNHPGESRENIQDKDFGTELCSTRVSPPYHLGTVVTKAKLLGQKGSNIFQRDKTSSPFTCFFPKAAEWHKAQGKAGVGQVKSIPAHLGLSSAGVEGG